MGNPFIPDEIEKFAKDLPALKARVERILSLTEAFLVDANAALKDFRADVVKAKQAVKDAL